MRFLFKTAYEQDIRLFRDGVTALWYGLLAVMVLLLPALLSGYYVGEITWVFIYGICGVSLMVLVGYTGLLSLGHAAFLGIGAYAHAYFLQHGVPWVASVALATLITTICGIVVGLPALRMAGIYLAIATLAFAVIIQEVFTRWETVTKGFAGMAVDKPVIFGVHFNGNAAFYYLCAAILAMTLWMTRNLLCFLPVVPGSPFATARLPPSPWECIWRSTRQSPSLTGSTDGLGRRTLRPQDRVSRTRHLHHPAFGSAAAAGDRGRARLAAWRCLRCSLRRPAPADHRYSFATSIPAALSDAAGATGINLIGVVGKVIGDFLKKPGVEAGIFGLILVLVILLEPFGMYGRWMKIRLFFSTFPMYKRNTFKRQKSYMKSERLR